MSDSCNGWLVYEAHLYMYMMDICAKFEEVFLCYSLQRDGKPVRQYKNANRQTERHEKSKKQGSVAKVRNLAWEKENICSRLMETTEPHLLLRLATMQMILKCMSVCNQMTITALIEQINTRLTCRNVLLLTLIKSESCITTIFHILHWGAVR